MAAIGPLLTTGALQQVGSYLGYTGHQISVVVAADRDPNPKSDGPASRACSNDGQLRAQ